MKKMRELFEKLSMILTKNKKYFLVVGIVLLLALPFLGVNSYWMNIIIKVFIYTIMALGLNILVGYTGLISLGQAAFVAIGAYTSAILTVSFGINFFVAMLGGIIVAALCGLLLGLPSLLVKDTYLTIITLGFGELINTVITVWTPVTNGPLGIRNIPYPSIFGFNLTMKNNGFYYLVLIILLLITLFCNALVKTKTGRALRAIKGDETAATMMGIKTTKYKVLAFVIAAIICAIAGSLYAPQLGYIDQNTFTFDVSILILSIVILGGMGTTRGMYVGALILILFPEVSRFLMDYRFVLYGLVLVLMMRFRPQGIMGWREKSEYPIPSELQINKKSKE